jgi:D-lactate dehydrogenase
LKIAFFDTKAFSRDVFSRLSPSKYRLTFFEHRLTPHTVASAIGHDAVCVFVNDTVNEEVVKALHRLGVKLIALRCAGYNNVDLAACDANEIGVVHVPAYSPSSVAEHSIALMLALNRHIPRAYTRVRDGNFSLDGLVGFEMRGKTVGVVGTGRIGKCAAKIITGFGCNVLAFDSREDKELVETFGVRYVDMDTILRESDIISLHVPLLPSTRHMIDNEAIAKMKRGVMIINTSRGALVDAKALVRGLKSGQVGSAGLDVYEEEDAYFFEDFSSALITDDVLARLLTFNNVLITSHQAFLTKEALDSIAMTTLANIKEFEEGKRGKELTNGLCSKCG